MTLEKQKVKGILKSPLKGSIPGARYLGAGYKFIFNLIIP